MDGEIRPVHASFRLKKTFFKCDSLPHQGGAALLGDVHGKLILYHVGKLHQAVTLHGVVVKVNHGL